MFTPLEMLEALAVALGVDVATLGVIAFIVLANVVYWNLPYWVTAVDRKTGRWDGTGPSMWLTVPVASKVMREPAIPWQTHKLIAQAAARRRLAR
jgi:hypothetical protein